MYFSWAYINKYDLRVKSRREILLPCAIHRSLIKFLFCKMYPRSRKITCIDERAVLGSSCKSFIFVPCASAIPEWWAYASAARVGTIPLTCSKSRHHHHASDQTDPGSTDHHEIDQTSCRLCSCLRGSCSYVDCCRSPRTWFLSTNRFSGLIGFPFRTCRCEYV